MLDAIFKLSVIFLSLFLISVDISFCSNVKDCLQVSYEQLVKDDYAKIINRYENIEILSAENNRDFIYLSFQDPTKSAKLYFDVELSVLKELNDVVIKDKSLVTAIANKYKLLILDEVRNNPILVRNVTKKYSDFKSVRIAFLQDTIEIRDALKVSYREAGRKFSLFLKENSLEEMLPNGHGMSANSDWWHLAGMGPTADTASLVARQARNTPHGTPPLLHFNSVKSSLKKKLIQVEKDRLLLRSAAVEKNMQDVFEYDQRGMYVLSVKANELFRKIKAGSEKEFIDILKRRIKKRFNVDLDRDLLVAMKRYYEGTDGFSPGIFIEKRVVLPIAGAKHGVFSIDLAGQGAKNATENMKGVWANIDDSMSVEEIVKHVRKAEKRATDKMVQLTKEIKSVLGDIHATGDDVVHLPSKDMTIIDVKKIIDKLGEQQRPSSFRPVHLSATYLESSKVIDKSIRSRMIVAGEEIEKTLRKFLEGKIHLNKLDKIVFGINLTPINNNTIGLDLVLNSSANLSEQEFSEVVKVLRDVLDRDMAKRGNNNFTFKLTNILQ